MPSGDDAIDRLILDSSAFPHLRRGHPGVLDLLAAARSVLLPVTVLGELAAGFNLGSRARENHAVLAEFLAEPFVSVLPTTQSIARRYGQVFAQLRRAGTPIPVNDIWIAAATLDCGGHLLTFDGDFAQVTALDCTILDADRGAPPA
jgi:predicted nucleic acid-binding protein